MAEFSAEISRASASGGGIDDTDCPSGKTLRTKRRRLSTSQTVVQQVAGTLEGDG
jgi:hypothetical protein